MSENNTQKHTNGGNVIMPPEWAAQDAVLIAWPHAATDWAYMLNEVKATYVKIAKAITDDELLLVVTPDVESTRSELAEAGINLDKVRIYAIPTNDTWARDFGPIAVKQGDASCLIDFKFNAWGMKFAADKDNLINSRLDLCEAFNCALVNRNGFVLEGGSIESDGCGTILTTSGCLLSKNRNGQHTKSQIEQELMTTLGARKVLWLEHGALAGDDTDGHIDTLARFAPGNVIMYVGTDDTSDEHHADLALMERQLKEMTNASGERFNLIKLPLPDTVVDDDGNRLPATYANFLITNGSVLVPTYRQMANDELALKIMRIAFPDHKIVGIDCTPLIKQHGSLHCVTMQLPQGTVNI